jgi:hypothetical protein
MRRVTLEAQGPAQSPLDFEQAAEARRSSLVALYLLGALTGGLYLLYWIHAAVKRDRSDRETSLHAVAAALGSAATPVQAAFLFDLHRRSRARRGLSTSAWACALPALLAIGITLALVLSPWRSLWTPAWLLAPLPFLFVQHSINRELRSARETPRWTSALARSAVGLAGAAATFAVAYWIDWPSARLLSHRSMESGEIAEGLSALYTVRIDERGWRQTKPGTIGDVDSDLELVSADEQSWLVSYVHSAREVSLHDTVAARRAALQAGSTLEDFREERRFAPGSDLSPVSIARYRLQSSALLREDYEVFTASVDDSVVEIIGYTSGSSAGLESIHALIHSIELKPRRDLP